MIEYFVLQATRRNITSLFVGMRENEEDSCNFELTGQTLDDDPGNFRTRHQSSSCCCLSCPLLRGIIRRIRGPCKNLPRLDFLSSTISTSSSSSYAVHISISLLLYTKSIASLCLLLKHCTFQKSQGSLHRFSLADAAARCAFDETAVPFLDNWMSQWSLVLASVVNEKSMAPIGPFMCSSPFSVLPYIDGAFF